MHALTSYFHYSILVGLLNMKYSGIFLFLQIKPAANAKEDLMSKKSVPGEL